jgi:Ca2+/H+ antiporter
MGVLGQYLELTKPRVVVLLQITALCAVLVHDMLDSGLSTTSGETKAPENSVNRVAAEIQATLFTLFSGAFVSPEVVLRPESSMSCTSTAQSAVIWSSTTTLGLVNSRYWPRTPITIPSH